MTTKPENTGRPAKGKRPAGTGCEPWWVPMAQTGALALAMVAGGVVAHFSTSMGMLPAALIGMVGAFIAETILTRLRHRLMKDSHVCGAKSGAKSVLHSLKKQGFDIVKLGRDGVEKL